MNRVIRTEDGDVDLRLNHAQLRELLDALEAAGMDDTVVARWVLAAIDLIDPLT